MSFHALHMNETVHMPSISTTFDWFSDLSPAVAARESWHNGTYNQRVTCQVFYRGAGPFAVACGAALLAEHVRRFRFSPEVIQRLGRVTDARGRSIFDESFLNHLQRMRLQVQLAAPQEGTLLLPGEPLLIVRGPQDQLHLLRSAFRLLFWESTHWATQAALARWQNGDWVEEDTPVAPAFEFNREGWKKRATYIGGGDTNNLPAHWPAPDESNFSIQNTPMVQIRRLFKGSQPLGDVWLTKEQEAAASVSKTSVHFRDEHTHRTRTVHFTRFQNVYQTVLSKGHPVLAAPRPGYFRQRTLKQMEAFHKGHLEGYGVGWWEAGNE